MKNFAQNTIKPAEKTNDRLLAMLCTDIVNDKNFPVNSSLPEIRIYLMKRCDLTMKQEAKKLLKMYREALKNTRSVHNATYTPVYEVITDL